MKSQKQDLQAVLTSFPAVALQRLHWLSSFFCQGVGTVSFTLCPFIFIPLNASSSPASVNLCLCYLVTRWSTSQLCKVYAQCMNQSDCLICATCIWKTEWANSHHLRRNLLYHSSLNFCRVAPVFCLVLLSALAQGFTFTPFHPPPTFSSSLSNRREPLPLQPNTPARYHGNCGGREVGFSLAEVHQELQMLQRQLGGHNSASLWLFVCLSVTGCGLTVGLVCSSWINHLHRVEREMWRDGEFEVWVLSRSDLKPLSVPILA